MSVMVKNKTNKNYKRSQKGRSMVEMLGVLAIIGVLSVGGVYGYGVAMKKHKANELLHRASMLASTVSAQIMSGKDPTELDTFADSNLGKFTLDYDSTKTTFDLKISELDGSVCSQLKGGGMVQKVECNETAKTASITYYKNLATDPAEGEKSPTGVKLGESTSDGWTGDDGSDCSADTKLGTECQVCIKGSYQDSDAKCEPGQICVDGMCTTPVDSDYTGCTRNSDCKGIVDGVDCDEKTCYCNYYDYDEYMMRSGSCTEGPNKGSGVCMEATYEITTVADDGIAGKLSTQQMDWFSAKNFCQAVGGSMISLKGSGVDKSKLGSYFDEYGVCEGTDFEKCDSAGVDWTKYKGKLSATHWWTKDLSEDSCYAFFVGTDRPYVRDYDRYYNNFALCE